MSGPGGIVVAIIAFLVLITIVVVVHEGGHFIVAKLSGIQVDEFAVGWGPRVASVKRGDTVYALRALPLGGFVRMAGMLGLEGESDAGERNFYRASNPRRAATILAGVVCNLIFGGLCLSLVAGQPTSSYVPAGEPTAHAGLVSGDVILSVGGQTISYASTTATDDDFYAAVQQSRGQAIPVTYQGTDGARHTVGVTPELVVYAFAQPGSFPTNLAGQPLVITSVGGASPGTGDPATILGAGSGVTISGFIEGSSGSRFTDVQISGVRDGNGSSTGHAQAAWRIGYGAQVPGAAPLQALRDGFGAIPGFVSETAGVLGQLFVQPGQASQQLSGPVGIAAAAGSAVQQGWVQYIYLIGLISLSLGFINVLPIPFLDGGRLLFIAIEAVRRRRLAATPQAVAIAVSLALIILVMVLITLNDINHLSGGVH
ncbi:MAG: M50 family metallopeptidase [Candidatus Dormibacteria bacterium]